MDSSADSYLRVLSVIVAFGVGYLLAYAVFGPRALQRVLSILAPATELLGASIAASPDIGVLGRRTEGSRRIRRITTAVDTLADRGATIEDSPVIDRSVEGFDEIASQMVEELGIEYPETIQSTPVATTYIVDGDEVVNFEMASMTRNVLEIERREKERFQLMGLKIVAVGFAIQLLGALLPVIYSSR